MRRRRWTRSRPTGDSSDLTSPLRLRNAPLLADKDGGEPAHGVQSRVMANTVGGAQASEDKGVPEDHRNSEETGADQNQRDGGAVSQSLEHREEAALKEELPEWLAGLPQLAGDAYMEELPRTVKVVPDHKTGAPYGAPAAPSERVTTVGCVKSSFPIGGKLGKVLP